MGEIVELGSVAERRRSTRADRSFDATKNMNASAQHLVSADILLFTGVWRERYEAPPKRGAPTRGKGGPSSTRKGRGASPGKQRA